MAVIGSIRKRTGLLIGFIAVALLMFLLMDALSSNSMIGGGGSGQNVGKINSKKVDYMQYQKELSDYENRITTLFPQAQVDATNRAQFRDEVWNNFASDALLGSHLSNMGISVSAEELGNSIWGDNPHFFAQNVLVNPNTRQYDPNYAKQVVEQAQQGGPEDPSRLMIGHLESLIADERIKSKYSSLFTKGVYVPNFLAKEEKADNARSASISYIFYPYGDVADTEISYSDKNLEKHIRDNEEKYKQEESREIKYYTIDIVPSAADTADALAGIQEVLEDYRTTDNDSIYVRRYSDVPFTGRYLTKEELATDPNVEALFTDEPGTFYEPYFYNGAFNVAKLKERKNIPDSVSARHMLLVPTTYAQYDSLNNLADSLIELLQAGRADFSTLAPIHSNDESNKNDGGDLGYFLQGAMVPTFNDAAFFRYAKGDVYKVESQFGIHIVKIDKAVPTIPVVKVAVVTQNLDYSKDTERDLFREANKFRTDHNTPEKFEAAEGEFLINTVSVTQNQVSMLGIEDARKLVQWSFKEKVGTINYFDIQDKYLVALIASESKEGTGSLENLRVQVEQEVKDELKAKVLSDRISASTASNIQELASATGKEVLSNAALAPSALSLQGAGNESDVVGHVFGMGSGEMSGPLEGSGGVYVVQMNTLTDPGVQDENFFVEKARLKPNISYATILEDLKSDADIDDTRYQFY